MREAQKCPSAHPVPACLPSCPRTRESTLVLFRTPAFGDSCVTSHPTCHYHENSLAAPLFVMPAQAGIQVPAPGFRLGGRNDGGREPVFIALVWPPEDLAIPSLTRHCHENRLAALPPSLPRKRESRLPHPWVPAQRRNTWGNRHFHPHTWPPQGHWQFRALACHSEPQARNLRNPTTSTPRHKATGQVLAGMDRFLTPLR